MQTSQWKETEGNKAHDTLSIPFRFQFLAYWRDKLLSRLRLCDALKITCHLCNCKKKKPHVNANYYKFMNIAV